MYQLVPFKIWHMRELEAVSPPAESKVAPPFVLTDELCRILERHNSWTILDDGIVVCSAGIIHHWAQRYSAWAYLTELTAGCMLRVTRAYEEKLEEVQGRIDTTVREDFAEGHRWARLMKFEVETPLLRAYGPYGEDHTGYVRFN